MPKDNKNVDILFSSHMHELYGGAEGALMEHVQYFHDKGLKVHVIVGGEGGVTRLLRKKGIGVSVIYLPWWARSENDINPYKFRIGNPHINTINEIVRLMKVLKPKLCVSNTIVVPWLAYSSSISKTRHVWFIHEMGTKGLSLDYCLGEKQTLRTISELSDGIFFNSFTTAESYLPDISKEKNLGIIYPIGETTSLNKINNPFKLTKSLKLVTVGQIKPQKGQLISVNAIKLLKETGIKVELLVIGGYEDQEYVNEIKKYIEINDLQEDIKLLGRKDNPNSYIYHCDASIISATNEAFGRVTVESMQLGKPVVGANSGGTKEIIKNNENGLLFSKNEPEDLAKKLIYLVNNPDKLNKMGKNAKEFAENKFKDESRYSEFLDYFKTISDQPKTSLDLSPLSSLVEDYEEIDSYSLRISLVRAIPRPIKRTIRKIIPKK